MGIILVTGGGRSGKSAYAQTLAETKPGPRLFIATCPPLDAEMRERIRKHRAARSTGGWETVEEELDLAAAISNAKDYPTVLVDCITLWVNNLTYRAEQQEQQATEDSIRANCRSTIAACREHPGTVIMVTNEVGMGIIPENPLIRRYRDLVGRANQIIAEAAEQVTLVSCGIPLQLKTIECMGERQS